MDCFVSYLEPIRLLFVRRLAPQGLALLGLLCSAAFLFESTSFGQAPDANDAYAEHVTQVIAHRGASKERPECTLSAISRAIDVGATAVEVDVRQSRDSKLFILHDATLERTTNGKGQAAAHSLEELKELDAGSWFAAKYKHQKIPTLAEVLRLCKGKIDVLLDLKIEGEEFANHVAEQVNRHGDQEQTIIGVRTVEHAAFFRKRLPKVRQLGLIPNQKAIEAFGSAGVEMIRLWPKWLGNDDVARELLKRVRTIGCKLHVNGRDGSLREVRELLAFRPDSLSSDDPNALQRTLRMLRASRKSADALSKVVKVRSNVPWLASRSNKGELSFLNRDYVFLEIPEGLSKLPRFLFDGGEGENIRLEAVDDVVVFAAFQYNDSGDWNFADGQTPEGHGWKKWGKSVYRGSSNGTLAGKPHYSAIYARSVKK